MSWSNHFQIVVLCLVEKIANKTCLTPELQFFMRTLSRAKLFSLDMAKYMSAHVYCTARKQARCPYGARKWLTWLGLWLTCKWPAYYTMLAPPLFACDFGSTLKQFHVIEYSKLPLCPSNISTAPDILYSTL